MTPQAQTMKLSREQERLVVALHEQERCYGQLLDLTLAEHTALCDGDVDTVEQLLGKKEHLMRQISRVEAERASSAAEIAGKLGLDPEVATLYDLSQAFPLRAQRVLTSIQDGLRNNAIELAEVSARNAAMLRTSLGLLGRWVNFLIRASEEATTYDEGGDRKKSKRTRVLDRKA